jgi:hypothetical protein
LMRIYAAFPPCCTRQAARKPVKSTCG